MTFEPMRAGVEMSLAPGIPNLSALFPSLIGGRADDACGLPRL